MPGHSTKAQPKRGEVSLSDFAYHTVRDRILKGDVPLGTALSRRKIAIELGMSLLPVSEAFQRLEADGLVESRPRAGTRVFCPTAQEIREHYQVREALESQSARLYAARATAAERRELQRMADHMDAMFQQLAASKEPKRDFQYAVHSYHLQLHLRIAEFADCRALRELIEKNHVLILNWLYDVASSRAALPPRFHGELAEALNRGNPQSADRAMRKHIRHGLDEIVAALGSRERGARFERVK